MGEILFFGKKILEPEKLRKNFKEKNWGGKWGEFSQIPPTPFFY